MLTVDNLHLFLLQHGLISPEAVLDGDLEVTTRPRRNRNLRATSSEGAYLVKQPEDASSGAESLRREAAFYALCGELPALAAVRAVLPRIVLADPGRGVLALELLRDAEALWTYYERMTAASFPVETAGALGSALATVHRAFAAPGVLEDPRAAFFPRTPPWSLALHRPAPGALAQLSAAGLEVMRLVQGDARLAAGLEEARGCWLPSTLVHGDVKLDNVLVRGVTGEGAAPGDAHAVSLVDWEMAQVGDPAWDVGGALHDFVVWWIVTLPQADTVEEMAAAARFPLPVLQPAMRALWRGYVEACGVSGGEAAALLARATRFAGVRLVQTGWEMAGNFHVLPAPTVLMLQVAANLFSDLEAAREQLFGIGGEP